MPSPGLRISGPSEGECSGGGPADEREFEAREERALETLNSLTNERRGRERGTEGRIE